MMRPPPSSTLFPYTALFRSGVGQVDDLQPAVAEGDRAGLPLTRAIRPAPGQLVAHRRDRRHVGDAAVEPRSEEHTSELQSRQYLVCRLLLEKKKLHLYPSTL